MEGAELVPGAYAAPPSPVQRYGYASSAPGAGGGAGVAGADAYCPQTPFLPRPARLVAGGGKDSTAGGSAGSAVDSSPRPELVQRRCTDSRFLLLFLTAILYLLWATVYGVVYGWGAVGAAGRTGGGGVCGPGEALYFPLDPSGGRHGRRLLMDAAVCVAECPEGGGGVVPVPFFDVRGTAAAAGGGGGAGGGGAGGKARSRGAGFAGSASSLLVEFNVNTPTYASRKSPFAPICLPLSPHLRAEFDRRFPAGIAASLRAAGHSLSRALPVLAVFGVAAPLVAARAAAWLLTVAPSAAVAAAAVAAPTAAAALGLRLLHRAVRGVDFPLPGVELAVASAAGTSLVAFSLLAAAALVHSRKLLPVAARVLECLADVLAEQPGRGALASAPLLAAAAGAAALGGAAVFAALAAALGRPGGAAPQPLGALLAFARPNGSAVPAAAAAVHAILFVACLAWALETILVACRFSAVYTGTVWYYGGGGEAGGAGEAGEVSHGGSAPSIVALLIGASNHLGTFAAFALFSALSRLPRAVRAWVLPRYGAPAAPAAGGAVARLSEGLSAGGLAEVVVRSAGVCGAFRRAQRLLALPTAPGRLFGAVGLAAQLALAAVAAACAAAAYAAAAAMAIPCAALVAVTAGGAAAAVAAPLLLAPAELADTLLYCYLLEGLVAAGGSGAAVDENPATKQFAHFALRDLVCEELQLRAAADAAVGEELEGYAY